MTLAKGGHDVARPCHVDGILDGLAAIRHDGIAAAVGKLADAALDRAADVGQILGARVLGGDDGEVGQFARTRPIR